MGKNTGEICFLKRASKYEEELKNYRGAGQYNEENFYITSTSQQNKNKKKFYRYICTKAITVFHYVVG